MSTNFESLIDMKFLCLYLLLLNLFYSIDLYARQPGKDDNIKAAFIYNFTKYVEWPGIEEIDNFEITIWGHSNLTVPLRNLAGMRKAAGKTIAVRNITELDELEDCQILVIASGEDLDQEKIFSKIEGKNTLLVGDTEGFARKGITVNFVKVGTKLKFELNAESLNKSGLKMSSHLMKLAIIVEED